MFGDCGPGGEELVEHGCGWGVVVEGGAEGVGAGAEVGSACGLGGCHWGGELWGGWVWTGVESEEREGRKERWG